MSKFDLRDISERLAASRDTEAVSRVLGYPRPYARIGGLPGLLRGSATPGHVYEAMGIAWYGRTSFSRRISCRRDSCESSFTPVLFQYGNRRSLLTHLVPVVPLLRAGHDRGGGADAAATDPDWQVVRVLPLADQETDRDARDLSDKKGAFGSKTIGEIIPLKSMAALAPPSISTVRRGRARPTTAAPAPRPPISKNAFRRLKVETAELTEENKPRPRVAGARIRDRAARQELESLQAGARRSEGPVICARKQSAAADPTSLRRVLELTDTQTRLGGLQSNDRIPQKAFQVLSQEHDPDAFSRTLVTWSASTSSSTVAASWCSTDPGDAADHAQQGIDAAIANNGRCASGRHRRLVAHNRKPLAGASSQGRRIGAAHAPGRLQLGLLHFGPVDLQHRLRGVLNLSNKRNGEPFERSGPDRAVLAGSIMAMTLGAQDASRKSAAWA